MPAPDPVEYFIDFPEGWPVTGRPEIVTVRGEFAVREAKLTAE